MLDIQFIRDNQAKVQEAAKNKNVQVDIKQLLELDAKRSDLIGQVEKLRQDRNQLTTKAKGTKPAEAEIKRGRELKDQVAKLDAELAKVEQSFTETLTKVPNMPSPDTPVGKDESANKVIRKWGETPHFDFEPKPHWELGATLDLIDIEKAAKVSGARFVFLKSGAVKLQFALLQWVTETLSSQDGVAKIIKWAKLDVADTPFVPVLVPMIIKAEVFAKSGRKDPVEDKYYLADDDSFLIGSAEHSLIAYHMDETLAAAKLPLRYLGYSSAFRREAGSYGKDVRGILRQHQFDKLEMESFSTPAQGPAEQDLLVAIQEYLLQRLQLPYQVVVLSTGDMGKPDWRQIDMETWLPAEGKYRETHSADYVTDFQARRLNIKYQDGDKKQLVHMNDATAFAIGRTLIAIMENYQTKDGKIGVPEVLQSYMGGAKFL